MAAREDILLRILSESSQAQQDLVALKNQLDAAIKALAAASKQPGFDPLSAQAQRLTANVKVAGQAFFTAFNQAKGQSRELAQTVSLVERELKDVENETKKLGQAGRGVSDLTRAFSQLRTALGAIGITLGARQILQLGSDAVAATVRMEALRAQINAAAGSVQEGGDLFRFASEQANRLGQSYFTVGEATARFEAATRKSNLTLDQRRFILQKTFETARVLQLSEQRLSNTLLAMEQIASKGTFSLEELRRQLGDNVPGAVQILADRLDVTVAQLFRMIEANEVSSESLLDLAAGMDEAFVAGGKLEISLDTLAAKFGQVQNRIVDLKVAFGQAFSEELRRGVEAFNQSSDDLESGARAAGRGAGFLTETLLFLAKRGAEASSALGVVALAVAGLADEGKAQEAVLLYQELGGSLADLEESIYSSVRALPELAKSQGNTTEATNRLADAVSALQAAGLLAQGATTQWGRQLRDVAIELAEIETSATLESIIRLLSELGGKGETSADKLGRLVTAFDRVVASGHSVPAELQVLVRELNNFADGGAKSGSVARDLASRLDDIANSSASASPVVVGALRAIREALQEVIDAYRSGAEQVGEALEEIAAEQAQYLGELTSEAKKAAAEALNLVNVIEDSVGGLANANTTQMEAIKKATQEALDAYLLLGSDVPPLLQDLADHLGVLSSVAEKELEKQAKAAKKAAEEEEKAIKKRIDNYRKLVEAIREATQELQPETGADKAREEIAKLEEELDQLEGKDFISPEESGRIQEIKDRLIDLRNQVRDIEEGFDDTSASVEEVDEAIRELLEGNAAAFGQLSTAQRAAIANLLSGLQSLAANGTATGSAVTDIFRQVANVLDEAGVNTASLYEAFSELDGQGLNVERTLQRLVDGLHETEEGQGSLEEQAKKTTEALQEQLDKANELADAIEKAAIRGIKAWGPLHDLLEGTLSVCESLHDCMSRFE